MPDNLQYGSGKMLAFNVLSRLSSAAIGLPYKHRICIRWLVVMGPGTGSGLAFGVWSGEGRMPQSRLGLVLGF